jgi:hypothetical protein
MPNSYFQVRIIRDASCNGHRVKFATGARQARLDTQIPSTWQQFATSFGVVWETITASSACAARWLFLRFVSHPSGEAVVRFDSQSVLPQSWPV